MAKQSKEKASPFDALMLAQTAKRREPPGPPPRKTSKQLEVQTVKQLKETPPASALAKSVDPAYVKFTTYVRRQTHLSVKTRLVSQNKELSDLVEELLSDWLLRQK